MAMLVTGCKFVKKGRVELWRERKREGKEKDRLGAGEGKRSCHTGREAAQALLSVPSKDSSAITGLYPSRSFHASSAPIAAPGPALSPLTESLIP